MDHCERFFNLFYVFSFFNIHVIFAKIIQRFPISKYSVHQIQVMSLPDGTVQRTVPVIPNTPSPFFSPRGVEEFMVIHDNETKTNIFVTHE